MSVYPFSMSRVSQVRAVYEYCIGPRLGSCAATTGGALIEGKADATGSSGSTTVNKSHRQHMKAGTTYHIGLELLRLDLFARSVLKGYTLLMKLESPLCTENESL
jgi:hypothetical protein